MSKSFSVVLLVLLVAAVGLLDYRTGPEVQLGTLYLIVVALAAWNLPLVLLCVFAAGTALLWVLVGGPYLQHWLLWWSLANRLGTITLMVTFVSIVRSTLRRQMAMISELKRNDLATTRLKGLVPVCRLCGRIQNISGFNTDLEAQLAEFEDSNTFGHVCLQCLQERRHRLDTIDVQGYFVPPYPNT